MLALCWPCSCPVLALCWPCGSPVLAQAAEADGEGDGEALLCTGGHDGYIMSHRLSLRRRRVQGLGQGGDTHALQMEVMLEPLLSWKATPVSAVERLQLTPDVRS